MHEVNVAEYSKFIFQSGDILMMDFKGYILRLFLIYIPIWWYSNRLEKEYNSPEKINLHSNLVIFKLNDMEEENQKLKEQYLHSNMVIFKLKLRQPL